MGYGSLGFISDTNSSSLSGRRRRAACVESVLVFHLMHFYRQQMHSHNLLDAFVSVEMPTVALLAKLELNGMGEQNIKNKDYLQRDSNPRPRVLIYFDGFVFRLQ